MSDHKCQSYRQQFEAALNCETPEEAEHWMEREVQHLVEHHQKSATEAVKIIQSNIGYMAGYYNDATAKKIYLLFNAVHPIFGTSTYHKDITAKEAFEVGQEEARKVREGAI